MAVGKGLGALDQSLVDAILGHARTHKRHEVVTEFASRVGRNTVSSLLSAAKIGSHSADRVRRDRELLAKHGLTVPGMPKPRRSAVKEQTR